MYTVVTNHPPPPYEPQIQPDCGTRPDSKSKITIAFGYIQIILSFIIFGWCIWSVKSDYTMFTSYMGFFSCLFHTITSVLAIKGGIDTERNYGFLISTLVLSIVGAALIAPITLIVSGMSIPYQRKSCYNLCELEIFDTYERTRFNLDFDLIKPCPSYCSFIDILYYPIAGFSFLQLICDIILASLCCSFVCQCCGGGGSNTPGAIVVPAPGGQFSYPVFVQGNNQQAFSSDTLSRPRMKTPPPNDDLPPMYTPSVPQAEYNG